VAEREAAASALLRSGEVLLIERAEREGDPWSGHVALPGGFRRPSETLLEAAVRETLEEVGVDLRGVEPLAVLGPFRSRLDPGLRVFLFAFPFPGGDPVPGPEVRSVFWIPLGSLSRTEVVSLPGVGRVEGCPVGGRVIWGLTLRMLRALLEVLGGRPDAALLIDQPRVVRLIPRGAPRRS